MNLEQRKHVQREQILGWRSLAIAMLILGIVFRFINLDKKVYWHDEAYTSLRVTAHPEQELVDRTFNGREVSVAELQAYQRLDPNRDMGQVLQWLAKEDPPHPPLHTVTLRLWAQLLGDSVAKMRLFSAVVSLLIFPAFFWLCRELFRSSLAGWLGVALISVSPFHVLFAQESREYVVLTLMTIASSVVLLRTLQAPNRSKWLVYTGTLILSFYTSLLAIPVAIGQGVYVLLNNLQGRSPSNSFNSETGKQQSLAWCLSFLYAILAFIPWLWVLMTNFPSFASAMTWIRQPLPLDIFIKLWGLNLSRAFIDFNPRIDDSIAFLIILPVLLLELIAIYVVCRFTSKRMWLLIVILMAVIAVPLALGDIISGGQRSTATRYLVPLELGLLLLMVGALVIQFSAVQQWRRITSGGILVALLVVGSLSCLTSAQAESWWNKGINQYYPQLAQMVNGSDRPLVFSDAFNPNPGNMLALSYLVNSNVTFFLMPQIQPSFTVPQGIDASRSLFFMGLPDAFVNEFAKQYQVKLVPLIAGVWRSQPRTSMK